MNSPTEPMKIAITAADLTIGDIIPGVGKVSGLRKHPDAVAITLDWATLPDAVLSADHVVWIEKEPDYLPLIVQRIKRAQDTAQDGLFGADTTDLAL